MTAIGAALVTAHCETATATLQRGLRFAVLAITATVLIGQGTPRLLWNLERDRIPALQISVYLICLVIIVIGAVLLVCDKSWGWWWLPATALVLLSTVMSWVSLAPNPGNADWHYGLAGWVGLVILFDHTLLMISSFISTHVALSALLALTVTSLDRPTLLGLANITVEIVGMQLAAAAAITALRRIARIAVAAADQERDARLEENMLAQLHADRRARYHDFDGTVRPLLDGLASGALDPGDPKVRLRCSVEAARLRSMLAESDEAGDQLTHEIQAAADVALRKGVVVTVATTGSGPNLPVEVRRAIIDPVLPLLMSAKHAARIALIRSDEAASLNVVSDAATSAATDAAIPRGSSEEHFDETASRIDIQVTTVQEGSFWWIQSRWTRTSQSSSSTTTPPSSPGSLPGVRPLIPRST